MTDLARRFEGAKTHLRDVEWSLARSEGVRSRLHQRRRRFALSTVALGSAVLAVAVAVAVIWFAQGGAPTHGAVVSNEHIETNKQIELRDGTRAVQLGASSSLRLTREDDDLVSFALDSGKGWFEVTPSATRRVQVVVSDVLVQVLGTEFVVEVKGKFVHVWVHRGKVKVSSEAGTIFLEKGEHQRFRTKNEDKKADPVQPPGPMELEAPIDETEEAFEEDNENDNVEEESKDEVTVRVRVRESDSSEDLDESQKDTFDDDDEAPQPRRDSVANDVDVLWKRADTARRDGRLVDAAAALTELLNDHSDDPRAPLAAFSMGRVLVDSGLSHKAAARAFAKARKLSPGGPLVEDALLREIEAWHDAGDSRRVRSRSKKYFRLFPKGRYRKQVLHLKENP